MSTLSDTTVAVLATNGFEYSELAEPVRALRAAGATVQVVSLAGGEIRGKADDETVTVDKTLAETSPATYDALVLPGGVKNPDTLRMQPEAVAFVRHFVEAEKPIAAICHGPWTLIEADGVRGKRVTAWPSLRTDLTNAGATWVDEQVVVDGQLVTSRKPADVPAFTEAFIELLSAQR